MVKKISISLILMICIFSNVNAKDFNIYKVNALNYLNNIRSEYNLNKVEMEESLDSSAKAHSEYMYINNDFNEEEKSDLEKFTGTYFFDRALFFNYKSLPFIELISRDNKNYKETIKEILKDPYERIYMLDPNFDEMGVGEVDKKYTISLGKKDKEYIEKVVTYPYNNQTDVEPEVDYRKYKKNPLKKWSGYDKLNILGEPITVTYYTHKKISKMKDVRINFFESSTNKNVKYIYNTIENDKDLTNTLIIIPLEKYKMNEKYILNIRLNFENEDKKSKFVQGNVSFFTKSFKQNVTDDIISINGEQYIDIKNHWIEEHFENLSENNIIFEKRKSEFAPDEFATRDEVTKMIANAFELENDTSSLVKFKDVTIKNKYYNYIDTVSDYGLIKGDGENFRPENNITREEFITIMMRIHNNLALNDKKYVAIVKDIDDASDYAKNHIIKAKSLNIIKGKSDNKFYPKDNITRAEVAIIINRIIEYFKNANSTII